MPQHMDALAKGNRIRLERAKLHREVVAGTRDLADLIANPPPCMNTAKIGDVLMWQHRWGRHRSIRFLNTVSFTGRAMHIAEHLALGAMTERQRVALSASLREQS